MVATRIDFFILVFVMLFESLVDSENKLLPVNLLNSNSDPEGNATYDVSAFRAVLLNALTFP